MVLVLAKSPVAGLAKTRLCPPATPQQAAQIAAAALLDTLATVLAVPDAVAMTAWTGALEQAAYREEVAAAVQATTMFPQSGSSLGERIAQAHDEVAVRLPGASVLQIGMDTPQLRPDDLTDALARLSAPGGPDAVLGPARDGGWWALGLRDPRQARLIESIPTSRPDTGARTLAALRDAGLRVELLSELVDVDTSADAVALVQGGTAGARFAAEVAAVFAE